MYGPARLWRTETAWKAGLSRIACLYACTASAKRPIFHVRIGQGVIGFAIARIQFDGFKRGRDRMSIVPSPEQGRSQNEVSTGAFWMGTMVLAQSVVPFFQSALRFTVAAR